MSQEMMDKTCREFAEALAAREPVPGGGSASAFVGALGASLCGMVARYGATNPALADRADDLTRAFAQADELAQELVDLVAEDVRAYGQVSAAYGIPREDPARPAAKPPRAQARTSVLRSKTLPQGGFISPEDVG